MIQATLAFLAGIIGLQQLASLPGLISALLGVPLTLWLFRQGLKLPACFIIGLLWAWIHGWSYLQDPLSSELEGTDLLLEGTVKSLPQRFKRGVRFELSVDQVLKPAGARIPAHIRLSWYTNNSPNSHIQQPILHTGERWHLTVRLKRPHGNLNPGGMDYERWLFTQGIGATGYVRSQPPPRLLQPARQYSLGRWRQQLDERITHALDNGKLTGVIKALTIGSRSEITASQWDVFRRTGTTHLVAISGLHIGLLAGLAFVACRRAWARWGHLRQTPDNVAAVAALLAAVVYAALADFAIPTQRALIMTAVAMGGLIGRRRVLSVRVFFTAVLLVLVVQPIAVLSAGFWLSFLAVAFILYTSSGRLRPPTNWLLVQRIHVVLALGLAPVLLYCFQQVSIIAPLANLVAVPVISLVVVPGSLLGMLCLSTWPGLGALVLQLMHTLLALLWHFLDTLADSPIAQWEQSSPSLWTLLPGLLGVLWLTAPKGVPARGLGAVLCLPMLFPPPVHPRIPGTVTLTVLDVGQGLAVVARTAKHTLVFDTGARFSERFDMGTAVVAPFLRSQAITHIDTLIISHADNDHKGGARSLAQQFSIRQTLSSAPKQLPWTQAQPCPAGLSWVWDGVIFRLLTAEGPQLSSDNDRSCVVKITTPGGSVLLSGDIEKNAEQALVKAYAEQLASDVLLAPHHGSQTSSTVDFLQQVRPQYSFISAGYKNRYRHPSSAVMARYDDLGIRTFNTADCGAITVHIDPLTGVSAPECYRTTARRYWHYRNKR